MSDFSASPGLVVVREHQDQRKEIDIEICDDDYCCYREL